MKKVLIVYGGWEGHEPKKIAKYFNSVLKKENFIFYV